MPSYLLILRRLEMGMRRLPQRKYAFILLLGFLLVWYFVFALAGFNPTDDGFVLNQSWRILHGQIPHRDFTSPRPIGSAYLHLVDVLPGTSLLAWSRLLVMLQLVICSFLLADIMKPKFARAPLLLSLFTIIAFCLNVNNYRLMAWHTIDGLFIGCIALWFSCRGISTLSYRANCAIAFIVAGISPLMKQGFLVVPLIVAAVFMVKGEFRFLKFAPLTLLAPLAYFFYFSYMGVLPLLLEQLATAGPPNLPAPFTGLGNGPLAFVKIAGRSVLSTEGIFVLGLALVGASLVRWGQKQIWWIAGITLALVPLVAISVLQRGGKLGSWTYLSVGVLVIVSVVLARDRDFWCFVIGVSGLGIGVAVSWGITSPSLVAGSAYVGVLCLTIDSASPKRRVEQPNAVRGGGGGAVLAIGVVASLLMLSLRATNIEEQGPLRELTGSVANTQLKHIRMQPGTARYLNILSACVNKFPAERVAITPDGSGLYPLLGLENPFPLDWWWPWERVPSSPQDLQIATDKLNASGQSYLVLVQTYVLTGKEAGALYGLNSANDASYPGKFYWSGTPTVIEKGLGNPSYYLPDDRKIIDSLKGRNVKCGPFVGKYAAP